MDNPRVIIVGSGGHGHVMLDVLQQQGGCEVVGFLDDDPIKLHTRTKAGIKVVGSGDFTELSADVADAFVVAIGNNRVRERKFEEAKLAGLAPFDAIHPSAVVAESAELEAGAQIVAGVIVNPWARLGEDVILNTGCTVDHDCIIGPHAFLGPGVHLGGEVIVGRSAFFGVGVSVLPGISIGDGAIIGAGAVVHRDVPAWTVLVGVPAKPIRDVEH